MHISFRRLTLFALITAGIHIAAGAETPGGTVRGSVFDLSNQQPLQYVQAALRHTADSSIVTGAVTDSLGRFVIGSIPAGDYYLTCQMIGYQGHQSAVLRVDDEHPLLDLGRIDLDVASLQMDAVEVSAEKLLYTTSIDRKVYNVDRDLVSKAGSASDLLQNVPSVQVDIDGTVSLRGSSNVLIMVDGRASPLLNRNGAEALEQIPANTIERIEVITNPSAAYKPDAAAGIINIVKKRNTEAGVNGSLAVNAGNGDRYNSTLSASYNPGRANFSASYGIRRNHRNRYSTDDRRQTDSSGTTYYDQIVRLHARPVAHSASASAEYRLNPQHHVGLSGSLFSMAADRREWTDNNLFDAQRNLTGRYQRNGLQAMTYAEAELTAFYERRFVKEDHTLRGEVTATRSPETENNRFTNLYGLPMAAPSHDRARQDNVENSTQVKLEYANPLDGKSALKAGYEAEFNGGDFDIRVETFDTTTQQYVTDAAKTNRFQHDETIHALYATYKRTFGKLGVLAGVRGEAATVRSDLVTLDSTLTRSYFGVYPSLHLSYPLGKPTELQLSYSKRTRRPDAYDLNPFPEYDNPRSIRAGNPRLLPEAIHSLELGCQYRQGKLMLVPALFYRYTDDRMTWVTRAMNDSVVLTTHDNLANDQAGGVELNISAATQKWLSLQGNVSVFASQVDASNLSGGGQKAVATWSSRLTLDLTLSATTRLQLSSNYRAAQLTATDRMEPHYMLNGGFRQELLGGKVVFLATVTDIFRTFRRRFTTDTPELWETATNRMDSRVVFAGFTVRFGAPPKKSRDDQIRYDDSSQ